MLENTNATANLRNPRCDYAALVMQLRLEDIELTLALDSLCAEYSAEVYASMAPAVVSTRDEIRALHTARAAEGCAFAAAALAMMDA